MSDELTMVVMLAITAGAALFVAWPLMFGSVHPEDFLDSWPGDLQQLPPQRDSVSGTIKELECEAGLKPRADLDVELEIEAFRRHTRQARPQDDRTGGQ